MATLERIRKRSGLLLIIIGGALLAFILTDLLGNGQSIFTSRQNTVVEVNGESYDYQTFVQRIEQIKQNYAAQFGPQAVQNLSEMQFVNAAYDDILREQLFQEQYEDLGLVVTDKEFVYLLETNPQLTGMPAFQDQVTGRFSYDAMQRAIQGLYDQAASNPQAAQDLQGWINFEKSIRPQALQNKYNTAVSKGLYVPAALAKAEFMRNNTAASAGFTGLLYESIADSTIGISESDIRSYYNAHKESYKTEASRNIVYVNFPIEPSSADKAEISQALIAFRSQQIEKNAFDNSMDTIPSFDNAEDDSTFAARYSELPVAQPYYTLDNFPAELDSSFFYQPQGSIAGPYAVGDYYRLTKISKRTSLPDSSKASHILISFQGAERAAPTVTRGPQEAFSLGDSLYKAIQNDKAIFDDLASNMSDDATSAADGGNLGWVSEETPYAQTVKDYILYHKEGDIGMVYSNFGVHIIRIDETAGANAAVQLTSISMAVSPSETTLNAIYDKASSFAAEVQGGNFSELAASKGYNARPVEDLNDFDENISGIGNNREIVKWAFNEETEIEDIQVFTSTSAYTVVMLTKKADKGYADPMDVQDRIKPEVLKEKKAKLLFAELDKAREGSDNIGSIAQKLGRPVGDQNITYNLSTLSGYGDEPRVIGYASGMAANSLSPNLQGERGAYIIAVRTIVPANDKGDYSADQQGMISSLRPRTNTQLYSSLLEAADVDDRRAVFY